MAADLKIRLIFSTVGKPRGRGKIERFFETITQMFLPRLPGFCPGKKAPQGPKLTLEQLAKELEDPRRRVPPHASQHNERTSSNPLGKGRLSSADA